MCSWTTVVAKLTSLITSNISNEVLYQYGRELPG